MSASILSLAQFRRDVSRSRVHVRASADGRNVSRAARPARSSAVTPADRASDVAMIDAHHSEGMRSLCAHFGIAVTGAPVSLAIAACDGQSSIMARNDLGDSCMQSDLGQFVLNGKAIMSCDGEDGIRENAAMSDRRSETLEKQAFIQRVKSARLSRFATQKPMCVILGIEQGLYKQYETRTPLPYRFIPKFCAATGVDIEWLLTGKGSGPAIVIDPPRKTQERLIRKRA